MEQNLTIDEYCLYLEKAMRNLHASKGLIFNVEMELKRISKIYSIDEVKKELDE